MTKTKDENRITVAIDRTFIDEVESLSGQSIASCYQCGECTAGCPVAYAADLMPNQVTRLIQLGQDEEVLKSGMIWLCVGCETCATRCPKGVELSRIMDALREIAEKRGLSANEPNVKTFHETFLRSIERTGRIHEISMLAEYKARSLQLFSDLILGARMFLRGKLALIPSIIRGRREIKEIFAKAKKQEQR
jgi:heterodisulfide reductase subunit C